MEEKACWCSWGFSVPIAPDDDLDGTIPGLLLLVLVLVLPLAENQLETVARRHFFVITPDNSRGLDLSLLILLPRPISLEVLNKTDKDERVRSGIDSPPESDGVVVSELKGRGNDDEEGMHSEQSTC